MTNSEAVDALQSAESDIKSEADVLSALGDTSWAAEANRMAMAVGHLKVSHSNGIGLTDSLAVEMTSALQGMPTCQP